MQNSQANTKKKFTKFFWRAGKISFQPFEDSPRKLPRNVPRRRPRKCPRKSPLKWSRFTCLVFPCSVRGKFPQRGFCTSWTRIWGRILGCEFLSPEFWGRLLGSNFLVLCFPIKRAPSKIHPQEIHRQKFTSKNSGSKIHIALLQGHFCWCSVSSTRRATGIIWRLPQESSETTVIEKDEGFPIPQQGGRQFRQKGIGRKGTKKEKKATKNWPKTRTGYQKRDQKRKLVAYPFLPTPSCGTLRKFSWAENNLVVPYRAMLRYYYCDTHISLYVLRQFGTPPKEFVTPPLAA